MEQQRRGFADHAGRVARAVQVDHRGPPQAGSPVEEPLDLGELQALAARLATVHDLTCVRFPELCTADVLQYPTLLRRAIDILKGL